MLLRPVLSPDTDVKNSTHRHDIVSCKNVIVDKHINVVAYNLETACENLGRKMIDNIAAYIINVSSNLEKKWNCSSVLTMKDQKTFKSVKTFIFFRTKFG